jgi:hypothetical protein
MSFLNKFFKWNCLRRTVCTAIHQQRGNLNDEFPSDFTEEEKVNIKFVETMTMTSQERLISLSRAVDYLTANNIDGGIVECGVWRGGSMMLVAKRLMQHLDLSRKLYLFDTFEGMSQPNHKDVSSISNKRAKEELESSKKSANLSNIWCYSSLDEVKSNIALTGYPQSNIFFIQGNVEKTLPSPLLNNIALLRLDTDWYESTYHELETLYDKVVCGGVIIIDDYGHWKGCKKAVDEFIEKRKLKIFLNRLDYTGRLIIKS